MSRGWFVEAPGKATSRWRLIGGAEIVAAVVAFWIGQSLPASGFTLLAVGPQVGRRASRSGSLARCPPGPCPGATVQAMLAAYRRTLQAVLAQARSMDQVVAEPRLTWLETPDQSKTCGVFICLFFGDTPAVGRRPQRILSTGSRKF